jgi:hypothetical protein
MFGTLHPYKPRLTGFVACMLLLVTGASFPLAAPSATAAAPSPPLRTSTPPVAEPAPSPALPQSGGSQNPSIAIVAPVGGEILDSGSTFNIAWNVSDPSGLLTTISISISTDGTNFTSLATVPASQTQYAWTVPAGNKQKAKVRLVGNCNCNTPPTVTSHKFTIWNPPANFTHTAEAPLFIAGQGFTSTIYLSNTTSNSILAELDPHLPTGNGTPTLPLQVPLSAGASVTVDAASLYTIGPSAQNPNVTDVIQGGLRLRHNGLQDGDVRAVLAVENSGTRKFTTPFSYPASSQSSSGTMLCAPVYYVDSQTDCMVAFQNATNSPQTVGLTCNYGTSGQSAYGQYQSSVIALGPQQTYVANMSSIADMFQGANWGSMEVYTNAPQSVVCHAVMNTPTAGTAWDCKFIDPAMSVSTTKVANNLMLDYNSGENAYIMVCNMAANSTTVTASFSTTNGATIPPVQVTVGAGAQQLITLNAQQLLSPGGKTVADARLVYSGSPSDIAAAGCSTTADKRRAVPVKFTETSLGDTTRLTSPFFRFDTNISGKLQVSNLGTTSIKAGAKMSVANSTAAPVRTAVVTVPAGGTAMIDLSTAEMGFPDSADPVGSVDLIHSGPPGTVTAGVSSVGTRDNSGQLIPLDSAFLQSAVNLFPTAVVVSVGACTEIDAITDGTVPSPTLYSGALCWGLATQFFGSAPNFFTTTVCVPVACSGTIPVTGGPGGDEADIVVESKNFGGWGTDLGTRLNPDGSTNFTLTAQAPYPNSQLNVYFSGRNASVPLIAQGDGKSAAISAKGPANHMFLGTIRTITVYTRQQNGNDGDLILKAKAGQTNAYYALDPPTGIIPSPPLTVPVGGGSITIKGAGFRTWTIGSQTVLPTVGIGVDNNHFQIPINAAGVPDQATIVANVPALPAGAAPCINAQTPCKDITVINPGGFDGTDDLTVGPALIILPPPAPIITGTASVNPGGFQGPPSSNSLGLQVVSAPGVPSATLPITAQIFGQNLTRVKTVSFTGAAEVMLGPGNHKGDGEIDVDVPAACVAGAALSSSITVSDLLNNPVTFGGGWTYTATQPIQAFLPGHMSTTGQGFGGGQVEIVFVTGRCEPQNTTVTTLTVPFLGTGFAYFRQDCMCNNPPANTDCPTACMRVRFLRFGNLVSAVFPGATITSNIWTVDCGGCVSPGDYDGYFTITCTNQNLGPQGTVSTCQKVHCHV